MQLVAEELLRDQSSAIQLFHEYFKFIFKNMKLNFPFNENEFRLFCVKST